MSAAAPPDPRLVLPDASGIGAASMALQAGKLVAFPSETVYGLGGDATNDRAVAAIYAAKGRPAFNPLIVHVASVEAAMKHVEFDDRALQVSARFCPGALSLVLPRRADSPLSLLVSAGLDSVAVRIPSHPVAQAILRACQLPVAGPSANPSGAVSPTRASHVISGWPNAAAGGPSVIVDGGDCAVGVESTVLDLTTSKATLLRPGGISLEEIEKLLGPVAIATSDDTAPKSPGMLSRHYAPETPLYRNETGRREGGVFLAFGGFDGGSPYNLSAKGDLEEAAAHLFSMLRQLDALGASSISVAPIPERGLGRAINDRLLRAATPANPS